VVPVNKEKLEKFKRGELKLGQVFDFDAKQLAALIMTGHTLFSEGRLEEARQVFLGLAILDGRNPYVHGILGAIHQKQERFDAALAEYSMALELYPQDLYSRVNRGEIHLRLGNFREAAADFKIAIDSDPDKKHPAANRARLMVALTQEALKLAKEKGVQAVFAAKQQLAANQQK
jgi:Flp pilus assembly protein TadD